MLYFIPRSYEGLSKEVFGIIDSPHSNAPTRMIKQGYTWCGDVEAFNGKFNVEAKPNHRANNYGFYDWLKMMLPWQSTCAFIVCPDVVGDAVSTLKQYKIYADGIMALGYKVAYVLQDGQHNSPVPDDCGAVFVGGSTEFKLGRIARQCVERAKLDNKWVHVGRVNTLKRIAYSKTIGADSVDGTHIIYGPDRNSRQLIAWMSQGLLDLQGN